MGIEITIPGNRNDAIACPGPAYTKYSQSFPSGSGFDLLSISLKMSLAAGVPGTISCDIHTVDGNDFPTGSSLGTATVDSSTFNTFPSTSFPVFTFSPVVTLTASTQYCFVISAGSGSYSSHYIYVYGTLGNPYAGGLTAGYNDPNWVDQSTYDIGGTIRSPDVPTKATNPSPTNTNTSVTLDQATVTWDDGGDADTFDVYYGTTSGNLTKVSTAQAGTSFTVTGITDGSPYSYLVTRYWRIDSTNGAGTTTGDEWSFTTIRLSPPTPTDFYTTTGQYYQLLVQADGSLGDPPGVGVENTDFVYLAAGYEANFIRTVRKLVAVAESKLWYEDI